MPSPTWQDIALDLLPEAVTWLLVVLGWLVVSDRQAQTEIAKNSYARMHRLREDMRQIEAEAVEHHTAGYDEKRVRTIMRAISLLGVEITHLTKRRLLGGGAPAFVSDLRKAVSAKNFDLGSYSKQLSTSPIIQNIEAAKDALDRVLLEAADSVTSQPRTFWKFLSEIWRRLVPS